MTANLGRLIKHVANQLSRDFDDFARPYDLTGTQMSIIDYLSHADPPVLQRDVEHEFNIQRSTATLLLQRMEQKQLVERTQDAQDQRQKQVRLLPKAKQLEKLIADYMKQDQLRMVAGLDEAAAAKFQEILENIIKERQS